MKATKYVLIGTIGLAALGLMGCSSAKVDVTDYITVDFSGVNGKGNAVCNLDSAGLEKALVGDDDGEISMEELENLGWVTQFEMNLSYDMDKDSELSNGDTVTVTVSYDEDLAKENKVKVTGTTKEFEVEGLKDAVEIDAFAPDIFDTDDGVTLEYTNAAPQAWLNIENNCTSMPESEIRYTVENERKIDNGDTITITAELPKDVAEEGYVLKETEKTITVEGLDSYVQNLSQLNEESKAEVLKRAENNFLDKKSSSTFTFHDADDNHISMNDASTTFSNFAVSDDVYETIDKKYFILPYTVDTSGSYSWIGREYFDNISKTYTGVNGYIVVAGLKVDPDGNLINGDDAYYEMGDLFENKSMMADEINADYGA